MDKATKTYMLRMFITSSAYAASIFGINAYANGHDLSMPIALGLIILPLGFGLGMIVSIILFMLSRDEVQQRYITEAALWTLGLFGFGSFTYGFVQDVIQLPDLPTSWILPMLILIWSGACFFTKARYA